MSGKELLDGVLASPEYQQAMSGLDVVFTACKDFSNGKIDERQVEKRLKKYLRRAGNDAADSVSELSEIFNGGIDFVPLLPKKLKNIREFCNRYPRRWYKVDTPNL